MRPVLLTTALATLATLLAACATGPRIYSSVNPQTDLTSYASYSYAPTLGTDTAGQPTSLLTQYLRAAVDREMQARGYRYVPVGGELLVNFYVETTEKIQSRTTGPRVGVGLGYYGYRGIMYRGWYGYPETEISQYTEGTLNIDVADAAQRQLVWEGVAIGRITEERRRNVEATVNEVVPMVFAEFPVSPSSPPGT
ncbi:MAG TPA: DUF4136 domain-containing protein [Gammaproteobacteria bacterium]|nr:DUF4136 domain-containing protein [Gammaproteobacteria bacterium]